MSPYPAGWARCVLSDIANVQGGITLGKKRRPEDRLREVPYLRVANVQRGHLDLSEIKFIAATEDEIETLRLQPGDVLMNEGGDRDKLGRGWIWSGEIAECIHQNHVFRVRLRGRVHPKFISHYANSVGQAHFLGGGKQTTNLASVNKTTLSALPLSLPPVDEQHRIITKLDAIFEQTRAAKARLERLPALLDKLKRSILAAAFRGELTADWRAGHPEVEPASALLDRIRSERRRAWERDLMTKGKDPKKVIYQAPPVADTDALPSLHPTWTWASIDEIATKVVDGVHKKPNYVASGVPFLTVRNLTAGPGISFDDVSYVTQFDHAEFIRRTNPERDDILISKDGTLGVVRRVETDTVFSIFVSVALIKPVIREVSPFLEQALRSPQVQAQMVGVGSGLQHIHLQDLRRDCIPLAPLDEQVVLVRRVDDLLRIVDAMTARCEQTLDRAVSLEQAALTKAFRGELVEQDPSDEPASVLLDRLRNSVEVQTGTTRQPSPTERAPRLSRPQRESSVEK